MMDSLSGSSMSPELRSSNGSQDSLLELEGLYGELQKETPTKYVNEVPKALECAICYGTYKDAGKKITYHNLQALPILAVVFSLTSQSY